MCGAWEPSQARGSGGQPAAQVCARTKGSRVLPCIPLGVLNEGLRAPGGGGGARSSPLKEGGGVWERGLGDRPFQRGYSKSSNDDPHHLRREEAQKNFFSKKIPHDTCHSALLGTILRRTCWGTSGPLPTSPVGPSGVPVT